MIPHRVESTEELAEVWPWVARWLESALESANVDQDLLDVYAALRDTPGCDLWVDEYAAIATKIFEGRKGREVIFWLAGGKMKGILELYPLVEAFARGLGCVSMTLIGRRGWERSFLRDEGWEPTLVHLEKRF